MSTRIARAVVLDRVSKAFQHTQVVHEVSLTVETGEFLVLLGPSGSGKTTILRMIAGFERPTAGTISIAGRDVTGVPPNRRGVGFVFQQLALFPHLTVEQNVAFGLEVRGTRGDETQRRVERALSMVHLSGLERRLPGQLSGGQQQRVALARALVIQPEVLLLDEPLGSLDKNLRAQMQVEIRRLQQQVGITTIMVTHDQEEAMTMGDRIAVLHNGRLEQTGPPALVYGRPVNPFVASFVGEANLFPVAAVSERDGMLLVRAAHGFDIVAPKNWESFDSPPGFAMVRPEQLRLTPTPTAGPNCLPGTVSAVTFAGASLRVRVLLETGQELLCLLPSQEATADRASVRTGSRVFAHWEPGATTLLPG